MNPAPISVGIPTFARGQRLFRTLEQLAVCDPPPAEVIVHVDQSDGKLEQALRRTFPAVRVLSSHARVGPGGGRHRCIEAASQPLFASFDDDSWPIDREFFAEVETLFREHPQTAVLTASIYCRGDAPPARSCDLSVVQNFHGCGHAMRVCAYRQTTGYIDRPWAYGIEEVDVAMHLHALGWTILGCGNLRVLHDTQLEHHSTPDIVAGTVQNVALRVFLRYPIALWPRGLLQVGNVVRDLIKRRRFAGLSRGLLGIPRTLYRFRGQRKELPADRIRSYLNSLKRATPAS